MHSKGGIERIQLPKNPNAEQIKLDKYKYFKNLAKQQTKDNRKLGNKGHVICTKMLMMKNPINQPGYLMIFPNFKHIGRKDGIGLPKLSPKSLGPINHTMSNLPPAQNLENFHQFAKIFSCEVDKNGDPDDSYLPRRIKGYKDPTPHRHKFSRSKLKINSDNVNIPLYSIYYDLDGGEHRYNYIQCRYFYCHWYEKLVGKMQQFKKLKKYIDNGLNVQILGYDGYPVEKSLYEHYLDESKPFDHELVLYSMLTVETPSDYPWNKYYINHSEIYENVI